MQVPEYPSALGKRLFTVAVIADTHLSEADGVCNSPFTVNKLANDRLRYVLNTVSRLAPDFAIHLGDIVHPVPAVPQLYEQAVNCFRDQIQALDFDLHLVPGNHDVGDKPIDWGPAGVICEDYVSLWQEYFGPNYFAVERDQCHFIVLNAQLINTGFGSEDEQRNWLETYLEEHGGERFFISLHYPPYLCNEDEREHYDNIAEPGRSWLLALLSRYKVEALFAGHVHHFWYYRYTETDCYLLPSTAFVRQDYSEMFRAVPDEHMAFGRNDRQKLGFALLEIYEHGHCCRPIRTEGNSQTVMDDDWQAPSGLRLHFPPHPRHRMTPRFGFDMRKDWLAPIDIPPSGGLDEFDRKSVRNDYPIMALLEMGVRRLRIPQSDLAIKRNRKRLEALTHQGFEFTLFSCGVPDGDLIELIGRHGGLIDTWEIAVPLHRVGDLIDVLSALNTGDRPSVYLSKLRTKEDIESSSETYYHVINHGFSVTDNAAIESLLAKTDVQEIIEGLVFRVGCGQEVAHAVQLAHDTVRGFGKLASAHIRMGSENPAESRWDETWAINRVAGALAVAHALPSTRVFVDTFADVDRGFFPRMGVLDALHNPRLGFHALRNLNAVLCRDMAECTKADIEVTGDGEIVLLSIFDKGVCLVLPKTSSDNLIIPARFLPAAVGGKLQVLDLAEGRRIEVALKPSMTSGLWLRTDGTPILLSDATT